MVWRNEWVRQKWLFWVPWTALVGTTFFGWMDKTLATKVIIINVIALTVITYHVVKNE